MAYNSGMAGKKGAERKPPVTVGQCIAYAQLLASRSAFLDGVAKNLRDLPDDLVLRFDGSGRMPDLIKALNAWAYELQKASDEFTVDAVQYPNRVPETSNEYAETESTDDNKTHRRTKKTASSS